MYSDRMNLEHLIPVGWTLRRPPGTDGYCWREDRIIDIGEHVPEENLVSLTLHEVAHAEVRCCRDSHCVHWWRRFRALCTKHQVEPSESDFTIAQVRGFLANGNEGGKSCDSPPSMCCK